MANDGLSRRRFLAGGAGLAGAALLAACGGEDGGAGTGSSESGTLNLWGGVPAENGPTELVTQFTKKYPKITVKYTRFVNDPTGNLKLDTALQGGAPIDVFYSYSAGDLQKRVDAGLTVDLTERVKADPELKFVAATDPQQAPIFDGKLFSVPSNKSITFVYVNKDMLDAAGVSIPDGWDVDEFHEVARQLSAAKVYGSYDAPKIAIPVLGGDANYKTGGKESNFDDPAWRREIQLRVDMIKDKSAFPETEILAQKLDTYQQSVFLSGKCALWISQAFNLRYINDTKNYPHKFTTSFAPFPVPAKGQPSWNPGGLDNHLSISAKSKNQEAAWTFLRWVVGEGAQYMIASGRVPIIGETSQDVIADQLLGPDKASRYDVDAFGKVFFADGLKLPVATVNTAASEIQNLQRKLTQQALLGQITVDQWVSQLKSQSDAAIAKAG